MRSLKFVRYGVVLLGLVVLCTKAQNGFCPMCTKGYYTMLKRSNPFWGQFLGQICKTDSHTHQSNKCAAFVSLRKADTSITEFPRRKSPKNQYINFTLQQEVVRKYHAAAIPAHCPCHREKRPCLGTFTQHRRGTRPSQIPPQIPRF